MNINIPNVKYTLQYQITGLVFIFLNPKPIVRFQLGPNNPSMQSYPLTPQSESSSDKSQSIPTSCWSYDTILSLGTFT